MYMGTIMSRAASLSQPISRASIINSLNSMLENGVLQGSDEIGKGGHRTRYKDEMNEQELKRYLA